jgi:hypothetical protein
VETLDQGVNRLSAEVDLAGQEFHGTGRDKVAQRYYCLLAHLKVAAEAGCHDGFGNAVLKDRLGTPF